MGNAHQEIAHILFGAVVLRRNANAGQVITKPADIFINRHFIVVEDDNEFFAQIAGLIQCFKGFPTGQGTITDNGDNLVVAPG